MPFEENPICRMPPEGTLAVGGRLPGSTLMEPDPDAIKRTDPTTGFADADKLTWLDVSNEQFREYVYPDGFIYRVDQPKKLNVKQKPNGDSHRIAAGDGYSHYVPPGWLAIRWKVKDGKRQFDF